MIKTQFTLTEKKQLTHDVWELTYQCPEMIRELPKPGQYVMFQLAVWLNRSYSIASIQHDTFTLIIKRIPDGKWSPLLCDAEIGTLFSGMIPLGHFILRETEKSKCFIGTGTGFAPLYAQLLAASHRDAKPQKIAFIFWVRNIIDRLYSDEIVTLGDAFDAFEYTQYFSREENLSATDASWAEWAHQRGYVTDWLTRENTSSYEEFYICGSPAMVKSAREILETLWVSPENIFWEQF